MEKKNYVKPNMVVVKLAHRPLLYDGSPYEDPRFGGKKDGGIGD